MLSPDLTDNNDLRKALEVAQLYYIEGKPQKVVSRLLKLSPAKVSRLLTRAKNAGLVRTVVFPPVNHRWESELVSSLQQYGIREVRISGPGLQNLGLLAARVFESRVRCGATVVVDGGLTVAEFVNALTQDALSALTVIPICADPPSYQVSAYEIMTRMWLKYPTGTRCLKIPYWRSSPLLEILRKIQEAASTADFVALGVGPWKPKFTALDFVEHLGHDAEKLRQKYSDVSAMCGYIPLKENSEPRKIPELTRKMPRSLQFKGVRNLAASPKSTVAIMAHSAEKLNSIMIAVKARLANTLIVDETLALSLLAAHGMADSWHPLLQG